MLLTRGYQIWKCLQDLKSETKKHFRTMHNLSLVWISLVLHRQRIHLSKREAGFWPSCQKYSLEKEMETHSSILAWGLPWTEAHQAPQSMGLQKSQTWLRDWKTTLGPVKLIEHWWEFFQLALNLRERSWSILATGCTSAHCHQTATES